MLKTAYRVLDKVYRGGAYVGIALNEALLEEPADRAAVTQFVYGTLEHDAALEYALRTLCQKRPKPAIVTILKLGLYQLYYSNTPDFAAVSGTVNLTKELGKGGQAGFVNAVLKQYASVKPPQSEEGKLMWYTGKPVWLIRALKADYPDCYQELLYARPETRAHVRGVAGERPTPYGAYVDAKLLKKLSPSAYVVQSLGSCAIASAVGAEDGQSVLDLCAAPGGKSVWIAEHAACRVTSCDLHPHRVELIRKYAAKRNVELETICLDATIFRPEWEGKFDRVLCDVPCSGTGVSYSKPDVLLKEPDPASLKALQSAILSTASRYVKEGGRLVYSTCSMLRAENDGIVVPFLKEHADFFASGVAPAVPAMRTDAGMQLLPDRSDTEGFYYAVLSRRNTEG